MKKLLALVLCVAMIASMCVFSTSAATYWTKLQGHAWYWDPGTAYGWLQGHDYPANNDVGVEFDIAFLTDGDDGVPSNIGMTIAEGGSPLLFTRIGAGVAEYNASKYDESAVKNFSGAKNAGPVNQVHVKATSTGDGITVWYNGTQVYQKSGAHLALSNSGSRHFFSYSGSNAVDNLRIFEVSTDRTVAFDDFEGGGDYLCGAGLGERIEIDDNYDLYGFIPGESVGMGVAGGTNIPLKGDKSIPTHDASIEFDVAFVEDNTEKGTCLVAPDVVENGGSYVRLVISRAGVGIANAYGEAEAINGSLTPLPEIQDASWFNQHHVKMTSTDNGITVWVDGVKIYENANAFITNHWAPGDSIAWYNLGGHSGVTALKNITVSVASTGEIIYNFDGTRLTEGMGSADYGSGEFGLATVPNYLETYPTVNVISGYTQLSYDGNLADKQVYTTDLALIPNENGVAVFTAWGMLNGTADRVGIKLDAATGKATVRVACDNTGAEGHGEHGNFAEAVTFDWGAGTYANMHKVVVTFDGTATVNIDGTDVYNSGINVPVSTSAAVIMADNGLAVIDNFSFVSGDVTIANDFENNNDGIGGSLKTIYPCGDNHTFSKFYATTTHPTCTTDGVGTAICEICGEATTTKSIAALGHNFTDNWDNADNVSADKREYKCRRCGEIVSTSLPAADDYNGKYSMYVDFKDKLMSEKVSDFDYGNKGYMSSDGHYSAITTDKPCWQPGFSDKLNAADGYVHSIDLRLNALKDGDSSAKYGHKFNFWFGGDDGLTVYAGIDFDNNEAFIAPYRSGAFPEQKVPVNIGIGEWHTYAVRYISDYDEWYASIELLIDGKVVCSIDEDIIEDSIMVIGRPETSTNDLRSFWAYDLDVSFDNYVIGSYDFEWTNGPELLGDVNGDGRVNMLDLLRAKKYVAGLVGDDAVVVENGDLDGRRDGIKATDIMFLKRLISTL